jgi:hypothetical protein
VWLAVNLVQGTLAEEFSSPLEWGFPAGVVLASLGVALLARSNRLGPATVVRLGLVYQVVISFGIAAASGPTVWPIAPIGRSSAPTRLRPR